MASKYIIVASAALITALNFNVIFPVYYLYDSLSSQQKSVTQSQSPTVVVEPYQKASAHEEEIAGLHFVATAYTAAEDECGKPVGHPDYGRTASGEMVRRGIVAVDTDVIPMHSLIRIEGAGDLSGVYEVKDTGGAIKGNRIDIYVPTKHEAYKFGKRNIKVFILREGK
mgnify:FL=1|nr:MAG TPA: lytic transglycosylase [Bacteriophage sp.]